MNKRAAARLVRAAVVVLLSLSYLAYLFQLSRGAFWRAGPGDWIDPYFINFLLENWHDSLRSLRDPSSPPMYFPARGTLGYSHGLILFAPFYVAVRPFVHAFQAHGLTLFLVIEAGVVCLYVILRRFIGLPFVESLLLTGFFVTSSNVINGATAVWSQRASVFLLPPILLIGVMSLWGSGRRPRLALAGLSGLLSTLLFVQDFYTAQFAWLFAFLALVAAAFVETDPPLTRRLAGYWNRERSVGVRLTLVTAAVATAWTVYVAIFGGVDGEILGVRIASHNWRRPALIAAASMALLARLRGGTLLRAGLPRPTAWFLTVASGGAVGCAVFLWIYLGAYREHPVFPEDQILNALTARDPSRWRGPLDFVRDLGAYESLRSFKLIFVIGIAALVPWSRVERRVRLYCLWFLLIASVVLLVPLRLGDFSLWRTFFARFPGLSVIRDPRRVIEVFELVVVLATAAFLTRLPPKSLLRAGTVLLIVLLLVTEWNRETFEFLRPNRVYERWVGTPIQVDSTCKSFFIKGASAEYMARSDHMWSLYNIDAMFVALKYSMPTLNGYSAWWPDGWELANPHERDYSGGVRKWIERHGLRNVCELDLERRTMTPYRVNGTL